MFLKHFPGSNLSVKLIFNVASRRILVIYQIDGNVDLLRSSYSMRIYPKEKSKGFGNI